MRLCSSNLRRPSATPRNRTRYAYTPEGKLTTLDPAGTARQSTAIDWQYTYLGGRQDGDGLYYLNGGEWDYRTGDPLQHDPMSYWGERLAYTPPATRPFDQAVITTVKYTHIAMDFVGMIPVIGFVGDLANAGLYGLEGNWPI